MATAKPVRSSRTPSRGAYPPRNPRARRITVWLGIGLAVLAAVFWTPINRHAVTGASYAARVGCSCRFVGGRAIGDCRKDFEAGMGMIMLSEDADEKSVTARFPLLSTQTATYREGEGCVLEPWQD